MKEKFIDHKFSASSLVLVDTANGILNEYRAMGYRLSLRQLYYQLVARDVWSVRVCPLMTVYAVAERIAELAFCPVGTVSAKKVCDGQKYTQHNMGLCRIGGARGRGVGWLLLFFIGGAWVSAWRILSSLAETAQWTVR